MSISVIIGVHDGLVIAADSASTLTISVAPNALAGVANVYDNANKIFNLYKGRSIGCVTYGAGSIGNSSIGTLIKDLRATLTDKDKANEFEFNPDDYTMEHVSSIVSKFLGDECQKQPVSMQANLNIGLFVGGYSTNASLGESWLVEFQVGKPEDPRLLRSADQPGFISWGGAGEVLSRIILGYSPTIFQVLSNVSGMSSGQPTDVIQLTNQLKPLFDTTIQAPLVFAPMPIQDAIDLARFLVHAAIMYSRFLPGPQIVGGPIEIATITKHEGFKWISRKHYYDQSLNREATHVIID